jgi:hypothetical protein
MNRNLWIIGILMVVSLGFSSYAYGQQCSENWVQQNAECNGYTYNINYVDTNNCGTTVFLPNNNGTIKTCKILKR